MMKLCRRLVPVLCLMLTLHSANAWAQATTLAVFYRVLMIQTANGQGTGFTLDVDGRQYLVTAKHLVTGLPRENTIQVRKYNASGGLRWVPFKMKIFTCADPVDIAVLVPREQLTISGAMEPGERTSFGTDVYFVGFPFGMSMEVIGATSEIALTSPFAYVRKAMLSAVNSKKTGEAVSTQMILDGYNLGGFSGSPVVYRPNGNGDPKVIAVISGFQPDYGPVLTQRRLNLRRRGRKTTHGEGSERRITTSTDLRKRGNCETSNM